MAIARAASLTALLALHVAAQSPPHNRCINDTIGTTSGPVIMTVQLPDEWLDDGLKYKEALLPDYPCGQFGFKHVGTHMAVCGQAGWGVVTMQKLRRGVITRTGEFREKARVRTTVYCTAPVPHAWFGRVVVQSHDPNLDIATRKPNRRKEKGNRNKG